MTGPTDTAASKAAASDAESPPASGKPPPGLSPPSGNRDPRRRVGDVAVELGFIDRELMEQVMAKGRQEQVPMGALLVQSGLIDST